MFRFYRARYDKIVEVFTRSVHETYILDTSSVFFDGTNYYFEIDREDEFRRKGPSKEKRVDPLVGMGLLLDKNCIPIGLHLYPGNQSEKREIRTIISKLKKQQNIQGKIIRVADKGLNYAENIIDSLSQADGYLFSRSVKQISQEDLKWILQPEGFRDIYESDEYDEQKKKKEKDDKVVKYRIKCRKVLKDYKYKNEKDSWVKLEGVPELEIVTYNPKLARKQKIEIDKLGGKAEGLCRSAAKKQEFGECTKFVDFESFEKETGEIGSQEVIACVNRDKIEEAKKTCGYNMLITSEIDMNPIMCYKLYHELSRIEETFRTLKTKLEARPVCLKNQDRITSQVCDFIRKFNILPISDDLAYNLSVSTESIEYIATRFNLPITNYLLRRQDLKKILNRPF